MPRVREAPKTAAGMVATASLAGALAMLLVILFMDGALFRGEVLSPADLLVSFPPWHESAPGHVAGNPSLADAVTQFEPWARLLGERREAGESVLWNDRAAAGQPLAANLQSAPWSPFGWTHRLLPFGAALLATAVLKLLLATVCAALLAARLGCSTVASALAGLAFGFGGFQVLWLGWPHTSASTFLPLLLLLAECWLAESLTLDSERQASGLPTRRPAAWRGPVFALTVAGLLLAGHVETALHVVLAVIGYVLLRLGGPGVPSLSAPAPALVGMAFWSVVGLALAAVQVLPFAEYLEQSEAYANRMEFQDLWRRLPLEQAPWWLLLAGLSVGAGLALRRCLNHDADRGAEPGRGRRAWTALLLFGLAALSAWWLAGALGLSPTHRLLLWPDADGHPVPARGLPYVGLRAYVNVNGGYAGLVTLPLAFVALVCGPRRSIPVRAFGWLGALAFVIAYDFPGLGPLANRLPLLDVSHNGRLVLVVGLALAVLAGFGLDVLTGAVRGRRPVRAAVGPGLALVAAGVLAAWLPTPASLHPDARVVEASRPTTAPVGVAPSVTPDLGGGPLGAVVPVTAPLSSGATLSVDGWALAQGGLPRVELRLEQGPRRLVIAPGDLTWGAPDPPPPVALGGHADVGRCGFSASVDLDAAGFEPGPVWMQVTLTDADGATAVVERRALRFHPGYAPRGSWWLLLAAVVGGLALAGWRGARARDSGATAVLAGASLVLVLGLDLYGFGHDFNSSAPPELIYPATPVTDQLLRDAVDGAGRRTRVWALGDEILMANVGGLYGLHDVRSYDAMEVERFARFLDLLAPPATRPVHPGETLDVSHPLFALLGVSHVLAPADWLPPPGARLAEARRDDELVVWRARDPLVRAFVAPQAASIQPYLEEVAPDEQPTTLAARRKRVRNVGLALAYEYAGRRDWREVLAVESAAAPTMEPPGVGQPGTTPGSKPAGQDGGRSDGPSDGGPGQGVEGAGPGKVIEQVREPDRLEFAVEARAAGWLFVNDAYFPGWRAWVDEQEVEIAPAFLAFRAVPVPAGTSRVVMGYEPASARWGWLITIGGVIVLLLGGLGPMLWRRRGLATSSPAPDTPPSAAESPAGQERPA